MDGSRFDDLTRALAAGTSRRGLLKTMLRGAVAGVAGFAAPEVGGAKAKDKVREDRRDPFWRAGRRCGQGQRCGALVPCSNGRCTPTVCLIDGSIQEDGASNPDNSCEQCVPSLDDWDTWTALENGSACEGDRVCCGGSCCGEGDCCGEDGSCKSCDEICEIDGRNVDAGTMLSPTGCLICTPAENPDGWSPVLDQSACGGVPGRVCCNGECCSPTECCRSLGVCEECGPHCRIGGADVAAGDANLPNTCEICDPERDLDGWSIQVDGEACKDLPGRVCCGGTCCPAGQCCRDGACGLCQCHIGLSRPDDGDENPNNDCEFCDYDRDPDDWSIKIANSPCGDDGDRFCCFGECCPEGQCCSAGTCNPCPCVIEGREVPPGRRNLANDCEECRPEINRNAWTARADQEVCGDDDTQVCCAVNCCAVGQCCIDGACAPCPCDIDGDEVPAETTNPANSCQVCRPAANLNDWTPVDDDTPCGNGEQVCCEGRCCPEGECCLLGACGTCLCAIGDVNHAAGTVNPDNSCEICDPKQDPFGWSTFINGASCADGSNRVCCNGECCEEGNCCITAICRPCGCQIGTETFADLQLNPDNECEWCDQHLNTDGWSPRSDEPCGSEGNQVCCSGTCCAPGFCCSLSGACEECKCQIGDQLYLNGAVNPDNTCLVCESATSRSDWTPLPDDAACGEGGTQVCCNVICCPEGNCCENGVCEPCQCTIEGQTFPEFALNPANECQHCNPGLDPLAWSPMSEEATCGEAGGQVCCVGECCAVGHCCTEAGVCEACRCEIGDQQFEDQAVNPDNACEYCSLADSTEAWTPTPDYSVCSGPLDAVNRYCCRGTCCQERECCLPDGTCGRCVCTIDAVEYEEGAKNPANDCQFCSPTEDNTAWTLVPEGDICGANLDQTCCAGVCGGCEAGCTIDGVHYNDGQVNPNGGHFSCEACNEDYPDVWSPRFHPDCPPPCTIDGVLIPYGTINPTNACEHCDGRSTWSPSDAVTCGEARDRACCNGVCCDPGECCTAEGICGSGSCEPEGCTIDGGQYANGTVNPNNPCQVCDEAASKTSWSSNGFGGCGPTGEQFCAGGVCCDLGICPNGDVCGDFCDAVCAIGRVLYHTNDRNPANGCEQCAPSVSHTSWTLVAPNFYCDPVAQQGSCCAGTCCGAGFCNTNGFFCDSN